MRSMHMVCTDIVVEVNEYHMDSMYCYTREYIVVEVINIIWKICISLWIMKEHINCFF